MIRSNTPRIPTTLFVAAILVLLSPNFGSTTFAWQSGTNGANGTDGNPGTDGEGGGPGIDSEGSLVNESRMHAFAGDGGNGGNGGNGVADDDSEEAAGGNGGDGGKGGTATGDWRNGPVQDYRNIYTLGGNGGNGGLPGAGTDQSLDGQGGDGGDGGSASSLSARFGKSSYLSAQGGNGGDAFGLGARAGNGGGTLTSSLASPISNHSSATISANQVGGNGGNGFLGADAGAGANVSFGNPASLITFNDDNLFVSRNLFLLGIGGSGGHADGGGLAGLAGDASVDLATLKSQFGNKRADSHRYDFYLIGGTGGSGSIEGEGHVSGANGGNAIAHGNTEFSSAFGGVVRFDLIGGNGGSALGTSNSGNGGHGGNAELANVIMNSGPNAFGSNRYDAYLSGGDGGDAEGSGSAGNGASVNFDNHIIFDLIGLSGGENIDVDVFGGAGGNGQNNGSGGSANVRIDQPINEPDRFNPPRARHFIKATATGGNAGSQIKGTNQADGGDADVEIAQRTNISGRLFARAVGGIGNKGKSGDARAVSSIESVGRRGTGDHFLFYSVSAWSVANFASSGDTGVRPAFGTKSNAFANAVAVEDVDTSAIATAWGGWGSIESGNALARSRALNFSTGTSLAKSMSFSHGDRDATTNNNSLSTTYSRSGGRAESFSDAVTIGHFNRSISTATSIGVEAATKTRAATSTSNWLHSSVVTSNVDFIGNTGSLTKVNSQSHSSFRTGHFIDTPGLESNAEISVAPTVNFSNSVLGPTPLADIFTSDADVLGLGRFNGGSADGTQFDGTMTIESHINVSMELLDHQTDHHMIMALFDVESTGNGFTNMFFRARYNDNLIVDQLFTSLDQATSFFDDTVFDLGRLDVFLPNADWGFDLFMTIEDDRDSFGFKFVYGNGIPIVTPGKNLISSSGGSFSAVPEPSGALLIGLTMIAMSSRRRRRSKI